MRTPEIEQYIDRIVDRNRNMMVPYYLMLSFLYYENDTSLVSDGYFDKLAKKLLGCFEDVEHFHKYLVTEDMLRAGTYLGEYPERVKQAAFALVRELRSPGKVIDLGEKDCKNSNLSAFFT